MIQSLDKLVKQQLKYTPLNPHQRIGEKQNKATENTAPCASSCQLNVKSSVSITSTHKPLDPPGARRVRGKSLIFRPPGRGRSPTPQ
jgi:hypothetical protein